MYINRFQTISLLIEPFHYKSIIESELSVSIILKSNRLIVGFFYQIRFMQDFSY